MGLNVDQDNQTGALGLYSGLGFVTTARRTTFLRARSVPPATGE